MLFTLNYELNGNVLKAELRASVIANNKITLVHRTPCCLIQISTKFSKRKHCLQKTTPITTGEPDVVCVNIKLLIFKWTKWDEVSKLP